MTQAVMTIIVILAILLSLHIFIIVWLLWQQHGKKSLVQTDHAYLVVYASQSGHAESWAKHTTEQLQLIHQHVTLKNIQKLTATDLTQYQRILWVVSTYGEGDAPDDAQHFVHKILSQPVDLSHLSFAILALGDKRYTNFCQFGQTIEKWLLQQQAQPLFSTVLVDQLNSRDLEQWLTGLEQLTATKLRALDNERENIELKFAHRQCLNVGSAGELIYKIQLVAEQELVWSSGDILEIQCENNITEIQQFLVTHQQDDFNDIDALKTLNLRILPNREHYSFAAWLEHFDRLPKREYSIASLPENGLIELVVRQQQTETGLGLGSGWLTIGLQHNQPIQAYMRNNPSFHLQHCPQPLILIGNGTGIAGLVAHLKQREQWGYGQNWLIFGERQQQFDHLYHAEIQYWQQHGFLQHVDYAFSRDQAEKIYVQDILKQQSTRLKQWIEQGAAVYVCGSLNGMAGGVDRVLKEILGDELVEQLKHEQRYQRDVY
ncbi:sulfite reductase flavoprotein subunit alpha [Acinetobacter corruptisaponis]|uniref:NADPH--hemoprotein reductase n=1 Tax=Acinetobacter corruptisaponis TaxID=3045147 RepID=A0ABY8S203_9GAMM|nr:sulfite reductase flavoprotein subunit alpha [Acinetobacter sp. KCTC 92772]WHP05715.1 sulfite reductase flavoprotein subunit alpha [Acinetobacter sp. KCTC 92772]